MREIAQFTITDSAKQLESKLLNWGQQFEHFAQYPGNNYPDPYHQVDLIFAAGAMQIIGPKDAAFKTLYTTWRQKPDWLFGYIGYDVKNQLEHLQSAHPDFVGAPELYFFVPEIVGVLRNHTLELQSIGRNNQELFSEINATSALAAKPLPPLNFAARLTREDYLERVKNLQNHIQRGDIYEVNFCQEFFAEDANIEPAQVFAQLNAKAHPPFAAFLNLPQHAIMCASPERYLQKNGRELVSQPIKGTARKGKNALHDEEIKRALHTSTKERAENVMIVDLVRNDVSKVAAPGSVQVPELFGVHSFPTVHQLISTVTAKLAKEKMWVDALKATFPMGSMTGAPKVRAMQLIEEFEVHKRGIYSGALGYITPAGDFDFNVVIRSLLYNKSSQYLSLSVGGAITILANAEAEYDECLLKAEAILGLFSETDADK